MTTKTNVLTVAKVFKAEQINAQIDLMHNRGQTLQTQMHKLACSILLHLGTNKDVRVVQRFVLAMPEMSRSNGLRNWFEQFGPVKFVQRDDGTEQVLFVKDKDTKLGDAMAKPFWKFSAKEGKPYEAIDLQAFVQSALKRLEKDAKETGRDHTPLIAAIKAGLSTETVGSAPQSPLDAILN